MEFNTCNAIQEHTMQYNTKKLIQYNTVKYNTRAWQSMAKHGRAFNTIQFQYRLRGQCNTIQCTSGGPDVDWRRKVLPMCDVVLGLRLAI